MSEQTPTPKPARSGPGSVLGRVAVGVLLSTPVAAVAAATVAEPPAAEHVAAGCPATSAGDIRAQFEASFTAGAVAPASTRIVPIICDR